MIMPDRYRNYLELQQHKRRDVDYCIETRSQSDTLIILAIHAGGIEMGTSELAHAIAGKDFSWYLFEGLGGNTQDMHITSTNFDEPRCLEMLKEHQMAHSLHGFTGSDTDPSIYLGGNNQPLIQHLLAALRSGGYSAWINTGKYSATDPANVCNRTSLGRGVQLELSGGLRSQFFEDYLRRKGRERKTPQFDRFVKIVRNALLTYSAT
jgi:phage replication-related protein YjqB (UPF0714/DUF867 family)